MRVFVTGGTGFIGSHFINQAYAAGHELVALRRNAQSRPRVPLAIEPTWVDEPMDAVSSRHLEGCDCLVHLAAHSANVPYDAIENCIDQNVAKPLRLFRQAIEAGVSRFLVAGSCFEYGRAGERYEFIPVDAPLEPTASYPASKAAASAAFHALACETNVELLVLRIFQVYGEGELETRFWPSLRRAALAGEDFLMSEGLQVRDFIHVSEVATRFVERLTLPRLSPGHPRIEHVGSGAPMALGEFARRQWAAFGGTGKLIVGAVPMRANEVMRYVPQI